MPTKTDLNHLCVWLVLLVSLLRKRFQYRRPPLRTTGSTEKHTSFSLNKFVLLIPVHAIYRRFEFIVIDIKCNAHIEFNLQQRWQHICLNTAFHYRQIDRGHITNGKFWIILQFFYFIFTEIHHAIDDVTYLLSSCILQ